MEIGTVKQVDIQEEMQGAYLDYAMSVIVSRALPDARDGLKPVHRRILYAMHDMGLMPDRSYKKSARIVGEVLGKYHPHGDTAVYDAMARMAQDFSLRYVLVDGQGNFGSIDGDSPAAMRYTEARLQPLALEMLADIDKDTVDFSPNFDDTLHEPRVLPAALPNLLVNGASGIAVGMATNIPPHNLGEVCDAITYLIDRYGEVDEVTVEELVQFVKGPDFPTGGLLYRFDSSGEDVVARAYASGRGHFRVQARAHIEDMSRNRNRIVVTELPYQVNKTRLIERIAELARDEKIEGITDLRDESDRTGMRIIIEMTRNVDPKEVLGELYRLTPMQQTYGMIMLALVNGEPRLLNLRRALLHFVDHRREIIRRRSEHELERARQRAHVLEGLLKALDILDEVIQTIRRSRTTETARTNLMRNFSFTQVQAQAILDMPLKRLAALERKRLQEEYDALRVRIAYLEDLLSHPEKILLAIKDELIAVKERYGDSRRTRIVEAGVTSASLTVRDVLAEEPVLLALGRKGSLLREPLTGRRRGKLPPKVDDGSPRRLVAGSTHDELFLFSADGRMGRAPIHRLQDQVETHPADLGLFRRENELVTMVALSRPEGDEGGEDEQFLVLATRDGRVKRVTLADAWSAIGVNTAMNVDNGDELIGVALSDGRSEIMLVTKLGQSIRFLENEVRAMGLAAAGVWGIKLSSGDEVTAMCVTKPDAELVVVTTAGYFKRTRLAAFSIQRRHGNGVSAIRLGQNSGAVADAQVALPGDEFFSASRTGTQRRVDLEEIPRSGRSALGKLLVQPAKGDLIVDLLHLPATRPRASRPVAGTTKPPTGTTTRQTRSSTARPTRKAPTSGETPAKTTPARTRKPATRPTRKAPTSGETPAKTTPARTRKPAARPTRKAPTSDETPAKTTPARTRKPAARPTRKRSTSSEAKARQLSLLDKVRSVEKPE